MPITYTRDTREGRSVKIANLHSDNILTIFQSDNLSMERQR